MSVKKKNRMMYGLGFLMLMLLLTGSFFYIKDTVSVSNNVSGKELPIYSVETSEKKIALTFDAAWGNEDTNEILNILEKHQVKVTFFMTGGWVSKYPEDVKAIYQAGHILGNHSENHKNMSQLSKEEIRQELLFVHEKVKALTGYDMCVFRPPYGDYNNELIKTAKEEGYETIQWSVDSLDWKDYGEASIQSTVLEHEELKEGAIILCHNGAKYTAKALEKLLVGLKEKGYRFVTIPELIYPEPYHLDVTGRQIKDTVFYEISWYNEKKSVR